MIHMIRFLLSNWLLVFLSSVCKSLFDIIHTFFLHNCVSLYPYTGIAASIATHYWAATFQILFSIFGITNALDVWCICPSLLSFCTPNPTSPSPLPLLSWRIKSVLIRAQSCSRFLPSVKRELLSTVFVFGSGSGFLERVQRQTKTDARKKIWKEGKTQTKQCWFSNVFLTGNW